MSKHMIVFVLVIFIGGGSPIYSNEPHDMEVKALIEKVKSAPASQRRVEMNALKMKLRSMNRESRRAVMMDLKKSFSKNKGMPMKNKMGENCKIKNKSKKLEYIKNKMQEKLKGDQQGQPKHKNRPHKKHLPKS